MKIRPARDLPAKGIHLSNSWRTRLERCGKFPRRVRITHKNIGYVESELDAWLESRVAARDRIEAAEC